MHDDSRPHLNPLRAAPNLLTLGAYASRRFSWQQFWSERFELGFILFVVAGLTDALDGALGPRSSSSEPCLGQYLDPVADKLLLSTLFLVLMHEGLMPTTVTVLVFGRDVGILLVAAILYAAVGRREFKPSIFGKLNTLAQVSAVAAVLLVAADAGALAGHFSRNCSRCHNRADRGLGSALRMGCVAPGKQYGSD